jgi:plastocyanin
MGQASVVGSISFDGAVPSNPTIDMAEEPDCVAKHQGAPTDPQVVVQDGKLANVFVYVKSGLPAGAAYTAPSASVTLDQNGCLYRPRVLGAMTGQSIDILNGDPLLHNIKAVPAENRGFNISQPAEGMTTTRTFSTPEVMVPLECNVHGWMKAYVGVLDHPFFAVSGADGSFSIASLPAGTYELEAWHEKFGTQTLTVTVGESGEVAADFTFTSAAS